MIYIMLRMRNTVIFRMQLLNSFEQLLSQLKSTALEALRHGRGALRGGLGAGGAGAAGDPRDVRAAGGENEEKHGDSHGDHAKDLRFHAFQCISCTKVQLKGIEMQLKGMFMSIF